MQAREPECLSMSAHTNTFAQVHTDLGITGLGKYGT